jgi:hypothetical protein
MIKVLVADDSEDVSAALILLIGQEPGFSCIGRLSRISEIPQMAKGDFRQRALGNCREAGIIRRSLIRPRMRKPIRLRSVCVYFRAISIPRWGDFIIRKSDLSRPVA